MFEKQEKTIKINPEFIDAKIMLGITYIDLKDIENARKVLTEALELIPYSFNQLGNNPKIVTGRYNSIGKLFLSLEMTDQSFIAFKQTLNIDEKNTIALYNLAKIYFEKEYVDNAHEAIDKCLELDPKFEDAKELREKILELLN